MTNVCARLLNETYFNCLLCACSDRFLILLRLEHSKKSKAYAILEEMSCKRLRGFCLSSVKILWLNYILIINTPASYTSVF